MLRKGLVQALPKAQAATMQFHPQYAQGAYFLRIHESAIEKIKEHYAIVKPIEQFASANKTELDSAAAVVPAPSLD